MVLIIVSWIYIAFTTINLGFLFDKLLRLKVRDFAVISILGLFTTTILASFWAFFGRINWEFHLFILALNLLVFFRHRIEILSLYADLKKKLVDLSKSLKILLGVIAVMIVAQCASTPYVIDNESYYIQTIKWINEYGFVKGLVNLHFFLGQTSGWHIAQSAFNFSFLYDKFNDLSGFCLLLGNLFSFIKLNDFFKTKNKISLIVGLLPIANIFFFQFISAPSPDIPVYIISFFLFFYFLENYKKMTLEVFHLITVLVLFILYIKNTSLILMFLPLLILAQNFKLIFPRILKIATVSLVVLGLFLAKNMIICGSPFFPSKVFEITDLDYAIPDKIETFYYGQLKLYGYFLEIEQYNSMNIWELFLRWLTLPKLNGLFNKLSILLILVSPVLIYRFFNKKSLWALYILMLLQLLVLLLTSPQYRFFINFILFFGNFAITVFLFKRRQIVALLTISIAFTALVLFIPINLNRFSHYKFMLEISNFSIQNIIFPYKNTKSDTRYELIKNGNLNYYSPIENDFFWGAGNGNLPSVNKSQIDYFETYFQVKPQMRGVTLKDGFYAKDTSKEQK